VPYVNTGVASFVAFEDRVGSILEDVMSLCHFSAASAVDHFMDTSDSNFLEALSELDQGLGILSAFDIVEVLKRLPGKGGKIVKLLDVLSSATLLWQFGLAPSIQDGKELSKLLQPRVKSIKQHLLTERTEYGVHKALHTVEGFDMLFTCRSKLRFKLEPDSLLANIMPLDAVGLLPSLSNVWDLIPFSFISDYLIGIGDALEVVDNTAIAMLVSPVESFHSVKIEQFFRDEDLAEHFIADGGTDSGYRYYERFHLPMVPPLLPTSFVTWSDVNLPNWKTSGSLIYQVLVK
jgi:hypothetical protein